MWACQCVCRVSDLTRQIYASKIHIQTRKKKPKYSTRNPDLFYYYYYYFFEDNEER